MPLAAPPEIFTPPTPAPVSPAQIGPPASTPGTPPATPAPAAANPGTIGARFVPPTLTPDISSATLGSGNAAIIYALQPGVASATIIQSNDPDGVSLNVSAISGTVSVTLAAKHRMCVIRNPEGPPMLDNYSNPVMFPDYLDYAGITIGHLVWSSDGNVSAPETGDWYGLLPGGGNEYRATKCVDGAIVAEWYISSSSPVGDQYSEVNTETGYPYVIAAGSSVQQVINAVAGSVDASALLIASISPGNDGTADAAAGLSARLVSSAAIGVATVSPATPPVIPAPPAAAPVAIGAVFTAPGNSPAAPPAAFTAPTPAPGTPPVITP